MSLKSVSLLPKTECIFGDSVRSISVRPENNFKGTHGKMVLPIPPHVYLQEELPSSEKESETICECKEAANIHITKPVIRGRGRERERREVLSWRQSAVVDRARHSTPACHNWTSRSTETKSWNTERSSKRIFIIKSQEEHLSKVPRRVGCNVSNPRIFGGNLYRSSWGRFSKYLNACVKYSIIFECM